MFKLVLSAGHGINTAGKRCLKSLDKNETREWYLNDRICDKIESKLKAYEGYKLLRVDDTTGKNDVPLKTRSDSANKWGGNLYLAIHHNAGINGGNGGGVSAYVYTSPTEKSVEWQKALYSSIIEYTGLKGNRATPLVRQNLHEVREPKMASVLLECGFMDSKTDVPIILTDNFAEQVASACVKVIVQKGKLTKVKSNKTKFKDENKMSTWAIDSIKKVSDAGIMNGDTNGNFNPKANITREEVAVIVANLLDK